MRRARGTRRSPSPAAPAHLASSMVANLVSVDLVDLALGAEQPQHLAREEGWRASTHVRLTREALHHCAPARAPLDEGVDRGGHVEQPVAGTGLDTRRELRRVLPRDHRPLAL